jgi:hypothetical protein
LKEDEGTVANFATDGSQPLIGQPRDLKGQVVLIRPKPRNGNKGFSGAQHVVRCMRSLFLGVAPGFEPQAPASIERARERAAIPGRQDIEIACLIDRHTVVDREAHEFRERDVRGGSDAHYNEIRLDLPFIRERKQASFAPLLDRGDVNAGKDCGPFDPINGDGRCSAYPLDLNLLKPRLIDNRLRPRVGVGRSRLREGGRS